MPSRDDDFVPVSSGRQLTADDVRADMDAVNGLDAKSDLDLHLVRMLTLHPNVKVRFRSQDLSRLDDATKQALLADMNLSLIHI